jgi:hypothetical protein
METKVLQDFESGARFQDVAFLDFEQGVLNVFYLNELKSHTTAEENIPHSIIALSQKQFNGLRLTT